MKTASAILLFAAALQAGSTPPQALLVLSKGDNALAIVDPSNLNILARIPCGPDPHEVIASSDGKLAYVSNYGGGAYNTLSVIDLIAQKALQPIDLGPLRGPHGLAYLDEKVWFTAEGAKAIGRYDPASKKVDWILGTGQNRTHMIWVSEDLQHVVTSNVSSATITMIDKTVVRGGPPGPPPGSGGGAPPGGGPPGPPRADWNEIVVPVGRGSEGFDVSPDGKQIWVANAQDGTISIIDVADRSVVQTLDADVKGANRLKFTPNGRLVFVSTLGGSAVSVFDASTRKLVKQVETGHGAAGILMQPDGARVFVACTPDDYVAIIDPASLTVTGRIQPIKHPDGLAWATAR
ncbi:MAG: YncE family protein [Acidobacteriaceae bacterium]|nr:YncE family protein [Acidobacteriaceae bacterium]